MIVLDAGVLSAVMRRTRRGPREERISSHLESLVMAAEQELVVPGVVYQELMAGIRGPTRLRRIEERVLGFPIHVADLRDHRVAAFFFTRCASGGIAATHFDCLIAAMTLNRDARLWTTDGSDYEPMVDLCGLALYRTDAAGSGTRRMARGR